MKEYCARIANPTIEVRDFKSRTVGIALVQNKLNISSLSIGIYFYKIVRKDNSVYTGKLLIE